MSSTLVFDEPLDPSEGPFGRLADWYRKSSSPEARAARSDINAWYAAFPDRNGMLLGNLRSDSDIGIQQATDEISWWGQAARRLRSALSRKAGSRYDHRNRPFAVLISVRDHSCDTYDIVNALYGDDAIMFRAEDPDSARSIRKDNGTFGRSTSAPSGKNRRLSCVFALMRGWAPGSTKAPTVIRFDNPFAEQSFPDDVLAPTFRFVACRNDSGIRMEWEPGFPNQ